MRNAKQEILEFLSDKAKIKCAYISFDAYYDNEHKVILKLNYTDEDYHSFLNSINIEYDNGYGGQILYGTVWLEDNTWCERGEYDGSEWWEHRALPNIPNECL